MLIFVLCNFGFWHSAVSLYTHSASEQNSESVVGYKPSYVVSSRHLSKRSTLQRTPKRIGQATLMSLVYANLQPPDSTANDVATTAGELLPHLLTLTAFASPEGEQGSGCFLLHLLMLPPAPLSDMERLVLPGLSSGPSAIGLESSRGSHPATKLPQRFQAAKLAFYI